MTDKRRKRPMMAASASHNEGTRHFHVVNIADGNARRRSEFAGRGDSWMSKVTTAMSHRIFSGKRLSGSRSTQVMPMVANSPASPGKSNDGESSMADTFQRIRSSALRQVSSENSLGRSAQLTLDMETTKVEKLDSRYANTVCSIDIHDGSEEKMLRARDTVTLMFERPSQKAAGYGLKHGCEKIRPRDSSDSDESVDSERSSAIRVLQVQKQSNAYVSDAEEEEDSSVKSTAPILKDFFSRSASSAQQERVQQIESRRESHYATNIERQEKLREHLEEEKNAEESRIQKTKIAQLRKLNLQRRLALKQEAARLKRHLVTTTTSDLQKFDSEREKWESDFQDEMRTLTQAYRKSCKVDEESDRPMTVAGLVVPQAQSQLERESFNYERRLKTAAPSGWSKDGQSTGEATSSRRSNMTNVFRIEDSQGVAEIFSEESEDFAPINVQDTESERMQEFMKEREALLQRIMELECQVKLSSAVCRKVSDAEPTEEGFLI